ncbi:unnamed protein product [Linum tenue]|uniref:Uncharacterized protein n=1 Tax=Linum tenue TaxID=586396 RepID=A0AAV0KJX8_9ROSI|nr:unnamed protein product [Linum tenue]
MQFCTQRVDVRAGRVPVGRSLHKQAPWRRNRRCRCCGARGGCGAGWWQGRGVGQPGLPAHVPVARDQVLGRGQRPRRNPPRLASLPAVSARRGGREGYIEVHDEQQVPAQRELPFERREP